MGSSAAPARAAVAVARAKVSVWMPSRLMPTICAPVSSCDTARMARPVLVRLQEEPQDADDDQGDHEGHQPVDGNPHAQNLHRAARPSTAATPR